MRIVHLGESLIIMKELTHSPATIANQLNQNPPPGLLEAVPAYDQLALYFNSTSTDSITLLQQIVATHLPLGEGLREGTKYKDSQADRPKKYASHPSPEGEGKGSGDHPTIKPSKVSKDTTLPHGEGLREGRSSTIHHTIPALYQAPDLEEVAQNLNLMVEKLIELHSQAIYTVEAIGFCPGFPYLSGLPPELQNLPRRPTPRTKVEPGTIAITGDQCCIYPLERPGGWNLIARTPLTLVDPDSDYFPLQVGDYIQFQPITQHEFDQLVNERL